MAIGLDESASSTVGAFPASTAALFARNVASCRSTLRTAAVKCLGVRSDDAAAMLSTLWQRQNRQTGRQAGRQTTAKGEQAADSGCGLGHPSSPAPRFVHSASINGRPLTADRTSASWRRTHAVSGSAVTYNKYYAMLSCFAGALRRRTCFSSVSTWAGVAMAGLDVQHPPLACSMRPQLEVPSENVRTCPHHLARLTTRMHFEYQPRGASVLRTILAPPQASSASILRCTAQL